MQASGQDSIDIEWVAGVMSSVLIQWHQRLCKLAN